MIHVDDNMSLSSSCQSHGNKLEGDRLLQIRGRFRSNTQIKLVSFFFRRNINTGCNSTLNFVGVEDGWK